MPLLNENSSHERETVPEDQPGADVTNDSGPRLPKDRFGRRLSWAGVVSLAVNIVLWSVISQEVRNHVIAPLPPITFKRIILAPPPKPPRPKKRLPKPPPKPKPKLVVKPAPILKPKPLLKPPPTPHKPPPAAHHQILTAKGPTTAANTALPGGHAQLGVPIAHQNVGEGSDNGAPPTRPTPQAPPQPSPPPTPAPPAQPKPTPTPAPPPPPAGPTQDAQPSNQTLPNIPDELKTGDYKSFVRVKVAIAADGSFSVNLLTSSGNLEIDQRVVDALKHWKWKPALQDGQPVASTQRFRFNFEVHA